LPDDGAEVTAPFAVLKDYYRMVLDQRRELEIYPGHRQVFYRQVAKGPVC
jgi:hypothetical protein